MPYPESPSKCVKDSNKHAFCAHSFLCLTPNDPLGSQLFVHSTDISGTSPGGPSWPCTRSWGYKGEGGLQRWARELAPTGFPGLWLQAKFTAHPLTSGGSAQYSVYTSYTLPRSCFCVSSLPFPSRGLLITLAPWYLAWSLAFGRSSVWVC